MIKKNLVALTLIVSIVLFSFSTVLTVSASAPDITLGEFNRTDIKISVDIDAGTGAETIGIIYVLEHGVVPSDGVGAPVYANIITTAANGTYSGEILFNTNLADGKTYDVYFYSQALVTPLQDQFDYLNQEQFDNLKKPLILDKVKACTTAAELKAVVNGTDIDGNLIDAETKRIISQEEEYATFDQCENKDMVFGRMITAGVLTLTSYNEFIALLESCSQAQLDEEALGSTPSDDNSSYGDDETIMTDTPGGSSGGGGGSYTPPATQTPVITFADMNGHWAQEFAATLAGLGVINGYEDGTFRGDNAITRAELTKIIVGAFEVDGKTEGTFKDVASGSWYEAPIMAAASKGIVTGYENGTFAPDANVTRQDAALMIYRALSLVKELPVGYTFFTDDFDIQDYASHAIRALGDQGIVTGNADKTFKPYNPITRAEVSAIICRSLDYIQSH